VFVQKKLIIQPSKLCGAITVPPSKSQCLRAILFAGIADGVSSVRNILSSPDTDAMIAAVSALGARVKRDGSDLTITGCAGILTPPERPIDAGNSGIVLRFITALCANLQQAVEVTGDHSIRTRRPIYPYLHGFAAWGVSCVSLDATDHAPLRVEGPIDDGAVMQVEGADSQIVSGLLIAASQAPGLQRVRVHHPGELAWVDVTLEWLSRLGVTVKRNGYTEYEIVGKTVIDAFDYTVPGDFSSLAFPLAAALITDSHVIIRGVDFADTQGDKRLIDVLISMGAQLKLDIALGLVEVVPGSCLRNVEVSVNHIIDALPILAVLGCYAEGEMRLLDAEIARHKECDRIAAMVAELSKMGADICETDSGLVVRQSRLCGAHLESYADHRMVLALAVAALGADGQSVIHSTACIAKSYPDFVAAFTALGASIIEGGA
jgi:3-phosphoshikimate 1-carboxyvinyltransferase